MIFFFFCVCVCVILHCERRVVWEMKKVKSRVYACHTDAMSTRYGYRYGYSMNDRERLKRTYPQMYERCTNSLSPDLHNPGYHLL